MSKGLAIVVCAALTAMLGGCSDLMHRQPVASLKDDMAKPAHALSCPPSRNPLR
jgi:stress-induced morphogen